MKTVFEKIIDREIPSNIVYETDEVIAFKDVDPQAPVHVLIVPKHRIERIDAAKPEDQKLLGAILLAAAEVARKMGVDSTGYRLVINNGKAGGETVPHLHCQLLGGKPLGWPPYAY